jgi:hypothetical protein
MAIVNQPSSAAILPAVTPPWGSPRDDPPRSRPAARPCRHGLHRDPSRCRPRHRPHCHQSAPETHPKPLNNRVSFERLLIMEASGSNKSSAERVCDISELHFVQSKAQKKRHRTRAAASLAANGVVAYLSSPPADRYTLPHRPPPPSPPTRPASGAGGWCGRCRSRRSPFRSPGRLRRSDRRRRCRRCCRR